MRKIFAGLLLAALICSVSSAALAARRLVCTSFPVYLFARNVLLDTETFTARLLIDSTLGCPHDYSLTPADLERLSLADALAYNGLGLETFLDRAKKVTRPDILLIDCSKNVPTLQSVAEGGGPGVGPNPHIFASPRTAQLMVSNLAQALSEADPANAPIYMANANKYNGELEAIRQEFEKLGHQLGNPRVAVGHDIFDYLAQDIGLNIVADIGGDEDVEPSAASLAALAKTIVAERARAILVDPAGNMRPAATLRSETGLPLAVLDPVASGPPDPSIDFYQKAMVGNIKVMLELFSQPPAPAKKP